MKKPTLLPEEDRWGVEDSPAPAPPHAPPDPNLEELPDFVLSVEEVELAQLRSWNDELVAENMELNQKVAGLEQTLADTNALLEATNKRVVTMVLLLQKGELGDIKSNETALALVRLREKFLKAPPPELAKRLAEDFPHFWLALIEAISRLDP